ncbi:hypothetical protein SADUNF_Sadunf09G0001300 [Salix dunnii]|uniref:Syndetin C-terminal domain-containing protein n=1 Tax=Salix dunnii TaxID=1413687 RepID=A0A835MVM5_9ROSI|nr:hypothetical protein SADUNF_Sadunf09G0001300 [Salix dunnii]
MLGSSSIEIFTTTFMYQYCNFEGDETKSNGGEAPNNGFLLFCEKRQQHLFHKLFREDKRIFGISQQAKYRSMDKYARYVDLLLGEFKHYKTRLAHGGIHKVDHDVLHSGYTCTLNACVCTSTDEPMGFLVGRHDFNFLWNTRWLGICGMDSLPSVVIGGQVEDFFANVSVQDCLSEYGLEIVAETLVEGLSRVKRWSDEGRARVISSSGYLIAVANKSDEGRALVSLVLQVLINGLQHFVPVNVKPKLQTVETFIKAYYLPETEYVHWARAHPEHSKNQIVGLINVVATMKGWKSITRLEVIEKIE